MFFIENLCLCLLLLFSDFATINMHYLLLTFLFYNWDGLPHNITTLSIQVSKQSTDNLNQEGLLQKTS